MARLAFFRTLRSKSSISRDFLPHRVVEQLCGRALVRQVDLQAASRPEFAVHPVHQAAHTYVHEHVVRDLVRSERVQFQVAAAVRTGREQVVVRGMCDQHAAAVPSVRVEDPELVAAGAVGHVVLRGHGRIGRGRDDAASEQRLIVAARSGHGIDADGQTETCGRFAEAGEGVAVACVVENAVVVRIAQHEATGVDAVAHAVEHLQIIATVGQAAAYRDGAVVGIAATAARHVLGAAVPDVPAGLAGVGIGVQRQHDLVPGT